MIHKLRLWSLLKRHRWKLAGGVGLIAISRVAGLVLPASTQYLIDNVILGHNTKLLLPLIGAVLLATTIQGVTAFVLARFLGKAAYNIVAELRCQVHHHVGRLPMGFHNNNKTGALVSRIMNDVESIRHLLGSGLVEFIGSAITALGVAVLMFRIDPTMTWTAFGVLVLMMVGMRRAFAKLGPIHIRRSQVWAETTGRLTEFLSGIHVIKTFARESREELEFRRESDNISNIGIRIIKADTLFSFLSMFAIGLLGAAIMYFGAQRILDGAMTIGQFATYTVLLGFLVGPVFMMVDLGPRLVEAESAISRVQELLQQTTEFADRRRTLSLSSVKGHIAFEDVHFSYETERPVLKGVSFEVHPGTVTALVGPSGEGKSTCLNLLASLYAPTRGRVLLDGADVSHISLVDYRSRLGVVSQDTFLFDGTIAENVAISRNDATREEIIEACRLARVDEFAERFPDGYDTIIGERGVKLSGGQRQRISIARAALASPAVLLLDEPTSSLDSESEAIIQRSLARLLPGRTTFLVAHRLSTVRHADLILVLKDGTVAESGTHDSLYARCGIYFDMYRRQHQEFAATSVKGDAVALYGELK